MTERDPVRELLNRKLREVSEEAVSRDGQIPPDKLDELNRLARLVDVRESVFPAHAARWRLAAVLVGTLTLVSLLLFLRVPETEVELDVVVSEVGFVLSKPQVLTDIAQLSELRASGLRDVQFSDPALTQAMTQPTDLDRTAIRVAPIERGGSAGTVTLAPINLPGDMEIRVQEAPGPAACRVLLNGARVSLRATVNGPVRVELPNAAPHISDIQSPRSLVLETDSTNASLQLLLAPGSVASFSPQLAVERVALSRIDEFQTLDRTTANEVSTILSGTIYLASLAGEARPLRPRELLRFSEIRGIIATMQLKDAHVTLHFRGRVRGMRSGWGDNPANLMPTWLEWLQARHGLSLLWGTTLYLFGMVAAILRWWRVSV